MGCKGMNEHLHVTKSCSCVRTYACMYVCTHFASTNTNYDALSDTGLGRARLQRVKLGISVVLLGDHIGHI
jgi:hypothetical protein